jgi:phosphoribosylformylglycinamidine synthase II
MATASTEIKVTPEIAAEHGLSAGEYARVLEILGRAPNITELGIFSVMWSEHCSYKSSKVHLKRLPVRGKLVVQGPGENAGVVDIGDGLVAAFKIESHNHPSYVEPFQGAATGVGGILRDIFTMGARPIAVLDSLRFGPITAGPGTSEEDAARNRRILDGVIRGIGHYGNCFGVPTVGGEVAFEPCYTPNPLVNALALGIAKKDEIFLAKARGTGNPVIYVGAKTGRDGIHGASLLASAEFTEESQQKRPNVQVGDPFMEKLLLEACLEAMRTGAVVAIQDMGAAGLTCSTCEMASRGETGIEIDLARVPQRETGMTPYEIMLSESQERMLLVAEKGREAEVLAVFSKWGLDASIVGEVTAGGLLRVKDHGKLVAEIPAHPLAEEGPVYNRPLAAPAPRQETSADWFPFAAPGKNLTDNFKKLLASPAIASKRWITEQYDSSVRTNTLAGPGASDAAVVRIKGTPRALALSTDSNSRWCQLNPKLGAMHAVAEAARNVAASGARPIAATNCLNFGSPEKAEVMWQFSESIDGLGQACIALGTPITGGNVSFYNETLGKSIYPTPTIGILGVIDDAANVLKIAFREPGDAIILLDGLSPSPVAPGFSPASLYSSAELSRVFSSSEYSKTISAIVAGDPPAIDLAAEKRLQDCLVALANARSLHSAHDIGDGGLAVTVAESCFAVGARHGVPVLGANISLNDANAPDESALFGERGARAIVSAPATSVAAILDTARQYGVAATAIGAVTRDASFRVAVNGQLALDSGVDSLRDSWANGLVRAMKIQ